MSIARAPGLDSTLTNANRITDVAPKATALHMDQDDGAEGSVKAAVFALVLTVISALAVFPYILPAIPT